MTNNVSSFECLLYNSSSISCDWRRVRPIRILTPSRSEVTNLLLGKKRLLESEREERLVVFIMRNINYIWYCINILKYIQDMFRIVVQNCFCTVCSKIISVQFVI